MLQQDAHYQKLKQAQLEEVELKRRKEQDILKSHVNSLKCKPGMKVDAFRNEPNAQI